MKEDNMASDQFVELSTAVLESLPRDIPHDIAQTWITDQDGLRDVLYQALSPRGISVPAPKIQQITFQVRLNYGETMRDKMRRGEFNHNGSSIYTDFDGHGMTCLLYTSPSPRD